MTKVDVLTIHFGINHGSVLQCYALTSVLTDMGADVEVIDYVPPRYKMWNNVNIKFPNKPLLWRTAYFLASSLIRFPQKLIFRRYLRSHISLTRRFSNKREMNDAGLDADVYIVGSDQVWNSTYNGAADDSYFLPFAPEGKVKASYAASIGRDELDSDEGSKFRKELASFNGVSVRETRAQELLNEAGVSARVDLDPVFFFSADRWRKLASSKKYSDRYVLVYVIAQNYEEMVGQARQIADALGVKLYVLSVKPIHSEGVDRNFIFSNPSDFLGLFDQAEFVISNSFHGTAFSIIFGKRFLTYATKYNSRIENILSFTHLEERLVTERFSDKQVMDDINFDDAHRRIASSMKDSAKYLQSIVGIALDD